MSFTSIQLQNFSGKTLGNVASYFGDDHQERVQRYQEYWDWYEGNHWKDAGGDARFYVTLNYIRRCLDLKKDFTIKNGFNISIPDDPNTNKDESVYKQQIKNKLDECWKRNDKAAWLDKCVQMGEVTGDVFVRISWDDTNKLLGPFVRADVLPSHLCFPVWSDMVPDLMQEFFYFKPIRVKREAKHTLLSRFRGVNVDAYDDGWVIERFTATTYERYVDEDLVESINHNLGVIPIVHIKNEIDANSFYGRSDVIDLISPQKTLNEKCTDISDIIDYHGSPTIVASGVKAGNITKGPDKVWNIPQEAEVKLLELKGDLNANEDFVESIYKRLLELASTPEQAINPTKNVSNTPGVALHMSYLPLIDVRRKKILAYTSGIEKIHMVMILMYERKDSEFARAVGARTSNAYATTLDWGDELPRDKVQALENDRSRLDMGLTTRQRILMRDGVGAEDALRIIEEADAERSKILAIEAQFSGKADEGTIFGNQRKPSPVIQGDRVSQNAVNAAGG